jgi:hypothetical protein
MFVYFLMDDAGSAQDIRNYATVAKALGHEVSIYGPKAVHSSYNLSKDIQSAEAVIFIFEWTTEMRYGDQLDLTRLVAKVPRDKRIVIDCDGAYNDAITVEGDYNHRDKAASQAWTDVCDSLSDKIFQPTLRPLRDNVRTFFFHAYDPSWERSLYLNPKEYGMVYVGHSKFRWQPMYRVLQSVEPILNQVGRIALVGHGWDELPPWAEFMQMEDAYYTDVSYLQKLDVKIIPPISSEEVITWMSKGLFSPVIYRPLFRHLQFVTCRTFETPAASTIPLFGLDPNYVREIYGQEAIELVLPDEQPEQKVLDMLYRPNFYANIVRGIREHLAIKHSYAARLRELLQLVND